MRDRLIEIFQKRSCYYNKCNGPCSNCGCVTIDDDDIGKLVDDLLANGVVVPPCKAGDMVYFVFDDTVEGKFISKQQINDVSTRGIFVSDSLTEENCGCFVPFSDFGKTAFLSKEEAERALKGGEPICDYTKTDWNDCCECSAKDYCDKYNERSEIIGEMLGEVIGEIKNEGR